MEGRLGGEAEPAAGPLGVGSPCRAPFPEVWGRAGHRSALCLEDTECDTAEGGSLHVPVGLSAFLRLVCHLQRWKNRLGFCASSSSVGDIKG